MEQFEHALQMLDLMQAPAFCVRDGSIIKVNTAASAYMIESGSEIYPLLQTGREEYRDFSGGCLYLTLSLAGHTVGASVTRMGDFDVFTLEQGEIDAPLQALALAARQLREPLSGIMAVSEKMISQTDISESEQESLSRINRKLFQMQRIIGNMSDAVRYTDISTSQQEVRNISSLVDEIFQRAQELVEKAGIKLQFTGCREDIYMLVDAQKLERTIFNTLSNAVKFTPPGGTITAALSRRGKTMYLSICDSGSGIADSLRGNLFSRYTREPALEDARYGLGLGMVLIRSTAAAHGGTVLVDHPDGCGTRITVTLAIRSGSAAVQSSRLRVDYAGERDHGLIELSDVLPAYLYSPKENN